MAESDAPGSGKPSGLTGLWPVALAAGLIWLGWQVVLVPISTFAPPEHAVRLAPGSADVLSHAAEAEAMAGDMEDAAYLARLALSRAPFDVEALRVLALAESDAGREDQADQLMTLAGNWSLRDNVAHGWLVESRLRQGNYASAFAHADTLIRRRADLRPQVFNLFSTAAEVDPAAGAYLLGELAESPPWRGEYLRSLYKRPNGIQLLASLAVGLEKTSAPFSDSELEALYTALYEGRQIAGLKTVRTAMDRPPADALLVNGAFADEPAVRPFGWDLGVGPGIAVAMLNDDQKPELTALRVIHDGRNQQPLATQTLTLGPGTYRLTGQQRLENGSGRTQFAWEVQCVGATDILGERRFDLDMAAQAEWSPFDVRFTVPVSGCEAQTLRLVPRNTGRRTAIVIWFSQLSLVSAR